MEQQDSVNPSPEMSNTPTNNEPGAFIDLDAEARPDPEQVPSTDPIKQETPAPADAETELDDLSRTPNATVTWSTTSPRVKGSPDKVAIPPDTQKAIQERLNQADNIDLNQTPQQANWRETLLSSIENLPAGEYFMDRLSEKGADFRQYVEHNNLQIRGQAPQIKRNTGIRELEGERAILEMMSHLGVGSLFRAPMWNSGFWVTFKPAGESELLELNRLLMVDKIVLGRSSYGLAHSHHIGYTMERVFNFALDHVYNTSVKAEEMPITKIRDHLKAQDMYNFVWGFLCANYPAGFYYETSCVADPTRCTHVVKETLNVTKLQWVDNSSLTPWQREHMASPLSNSKSLASVQRYQEEVERAHEKMLIVNEGTQHEIGILLRSSTMMEYFNRTHEWIGGIVDAVNQAMGMDADIDARNAHINQIGRSSMLCQYSHYVKEIHHGELTAPAEGTDEPSVSVVKERNTILKQLQSLSAIDSIRDQILDKIKDYVNTSTLSIIGVPAYNCPACGKPQEIKSDYPHSDTIIPLDIFQVFFELLTQRVSRIQER